MEFTTKIPLIKSSYPINYNSEMILLGSCFAENMGNKLDFFKFQNIVNPFGIIYNPVSIAKLITRVKAKKYFCEEDIFFYQEAWHCFEVHSQLDHPNKDTYLFRLNTLLDNLHQKLCKASHIIITLGTAWVYSYKKVGIVANCYKIPQKEFTKELLTIKIIQKALETMVDSITTINKNVQFIFTISPVRHSKDGFINNQISKANLIVALHEFINNKANQEYFPSYEIMMDELRDYRFYAQDMLHPNEIALDYIWQCFIHSHLDFAALPYMKSIGSIQKSLLHRPFNPDSLKHKEFLVQLDEKIKDLQDKIPHLMNWKIN